MEPSEQTLSQRRATNGRRCLTATAVALTNVARVLVAAALSLAAIFTAGVWHSHQAQTPTARIFGLGATTCQQFTDDAKANAAVRRDYLAWTQGGMGGVISSRPPGDDEGLDLAPITFDLIRQLQFLEDHCARNSSIDFLDAVAALYKRLRLEGRREI